MINNNNIIWYVCIYLFNRFKFNLLQRLTGITVFVSHVETNGQRTSKQNTKIDLNGIHLNANQECVS